LINFTDESEDCCSHISTEDESTNEVRKVESVTLDSFMKGTFSMGKMDIEGAEPFALRGASQSLRACNPPVWIIELGGYSKKYGISTPEVISQLRTKGYGCYIYDPTKKILISITRPWEHGVQNVLAIADDYYGFVEERIKSS
jgi:hypothetical protein